jgi:hypothetical protein
VSNLENGDPLWFGQERKPQRLDEFFRGAVEERAEEAHRGGLCGYVAVPAEPGGVGSRCRIVSDKLHILQHANDAVDEVRRASFSTEREEVARSEERQQVPAVKPLEEPGAATWRAQPALPDQPAGMLPLTG